MHRTPPKSPKMKTGHSFSDPNLTSMPSDTDKNITIRSKRQRTEYSPNNTITQSPCACSELKNEVMQMLTAWKADQDIRLSTWKAEQDAVLSSLVNYVSELKRQCAEIQKTTLELDSSMTYFNKEFEEMRGKVSDLEKRYNKNDESVGLLECQIQDLSRQSRPATIELRNVPAKDNEKPEDLRSIVSGVGRVLDMEIHDSNLRDIYRLPGKPGTSRSIVAEFTSVSRRNDFLSNIRRFNKERPVNDKLNTQTIGLTGDKKPIYVAEHLSPSMRKLFYESRQIAKSQKLSCWTLNGKIFMRKDPEDKPFQIKSARCLSELTSKK